MFYKCEELKNKPLFEHKSLVDESESELTPGPVLDVCPLDYAAGIQPQPS